MKEAQAIRNTRAILVSDLRTAEAKVEISRKNRQRIELLLAEARAQEKCAEDELRDIVDRIDDLP